MIERQLIFAERGNFVNRKGEGEVLFLLVQEKDEKNDAPGCFLNGIFPLSLRRGNAPFLDKDKEKVDKASLNKVEN